MTRLSIIGALAAVLICCGLAFMLDRAETRAEDLATELRAVTADRDAIKKRNDQLERSALERMADETAVDRLSKDMNDAIKDIPVGTAPSPAAVAVGCARLQRAGATTSDAFKRICGGR